MGHDEGHGIFRRTIVVAEHQMERREDTTTQRPVRRLWPSRGHKAMRTWTGVAEGMDRGVGH